MADMGVAVVGQVEGELDQMRGSGTKSFKYSSSKKRIVQVAATRILGGIGAKKGRWRAREPS